MPMLQNSFEKAVLYTGSVKCHSPKSCRTGTLQRAILTAAAATANQPTPRVSTTTAQPCAMTEKRSISLALGKTAATSRSRAPQWPRALPGRAKIPARSWRDLGLRWPARACASLRGPRAARRGGGFTGDRISGCAARRRPRELAAAGPRREQERPEPAPTCNKPLVYEVPKIIRKIRGQLPTNATLLHVL